MAGLRPGAPGCIRAAFATAGLRRSQRSTRRRVQVGHKKNHLDFAVAEGIWREAGRGPGGAGTADSRPGPRPGSGCAALRSPEEGPQAPAWPGLQGTGGRGISRSALEIVPGTLADARDGHSDVPGQAYYRARRAPRPRPPSPEEALRPAPAPRVEAASCAPQGPAPPDAGDVDMQPVGEARPPARPPEAGRRPPGRARGTRSPPRLAGERDRAPKLRLSKRKLELLLAEPVKTKRRK